MGGGARREGEGGSVKDIEREDIWKGRNEGGMESEGVWMYGTKRRDSSEFRALGSCTEKERGVEHHRGWMGRCNHKMMGGRGSGWVSGLVVRCKR